MKFIEYCVFVTFDDDRFFDGINATTEKEALQIAYWNWELAINIEIIK